MASFTTPLSELSAYSRGSRKGPARYSGPRTGKDAWKNFCQEAERVARERLTIIHDVYGDEVSDEWAENVGCYHIRVESGLLVWVGTSGGWGLRTGSVNREFCIEAKALKAAGQYASHIWIFTLEKPCPSCSSKLYYAARFWYRPDQLKVLFGPNLEEYDPLSVNRSHYIPPPIKNPPVKPGQWYEVVKYRGRRQIRRKIQDPSGDPWSD